MERGPSIVRTTDSEVMNLIMRDDIIRLDGPHIHTDTYMHIGTASHYGVAEISRISKQII